MPLEKAGPLERAIVQTAREKGKQGCPIAYICIDLRDPEHNIWYTSRYIHMLSGQSLPLNFAEVVISVACSNAGQSHSYLVGQCAGLRNSIDIIEIRKHIMATCRGCSDPICCPLCTGKGTLFHPLSVDAGPIFWACWWKRLSSVDYRLCWTEMKLPLHTLVQRIVYKWKVSCIREL